MFYDISPRLSSKTAVFPGDVGFSRSVHLSFGQGHHLDLSSITTTLHVGAHADAPSHYAAAGVTIENRGLEFYLGDAQVVEVQIDKGARIHVRDLNGLEIKSPRVLFKTNSFPDPNSWINDFNSLSPELIRFLKQSGVKLVGIDTPSVDPWDSKALESHAEIYSCDMAVLEGIVLQHVPVGLYKLVALPLPIEGGDASPVRAILVSPQDWARL